MNYTEGLARKHGTQGVEAEEPTWAADASSDVHGKWVVLRHGEQAVAYMDRNMVVNAEQVAETLAKLLNELTGRKAGTLLRFMRLPDGTCPECGLLDERERGDDLCAAANVRQLVEKCSRSSEALKRVLAADGDGSRLDLVELQALLDAAPEGVDG